MSAHKILLYNKTWDMSDEVRMVAIAEDFVLTNERKYLDEAVAVIFHMPTLSRNDSILTADSKKRGQLWVFWSMECEVNYSWQYSKNILELFDISATYKMDADIPLPYIHTTYLERLRRAPGEKVSLINAFISSPANHSGRLDYLQELMKYVHVDSYGKMLNNRQIENDKGWDTKEETIERYKFTIAFENAIAPDYVTEKFFQPLIAGSVPVYLGARNVEEFAPGAHCYIDVNSFSSPRSLAEHLLELDADMDRYMEYLQWKKLPYSESFLSNCHRGNQNIHARLCEIVRLRMI